MAQYTDHYNLTKPSGSENALISDINANMDILDDAIYDASQHGGITVGPEEPEEDLAWIDTDEEGADFCYVGDTEPSNDGSVAIWVDTSEDFIPPTYDFIGVETKTLLWQNASPTSEFAGQTISLDLTDYEFIEIEVLSRRDREQVAFFKGEIGKLLYMAIPTGSEIRKRDVTSLTTSEITFSNGGNLTYGSGTETVNNGRIVPTKIWGIKKVVF